MFKLGGQEIANHSIPHTTPFLLNIGETLDVGSDTRTPVDDNDYQVPFRFNGKIDKVNVKLGPDQLMPEDLKVSQGVIKPSPQLNP